MLHDSNSKLSSGGSLLAAGLSLGAAAGYLVVWSLSLKGMAVDRPETHPRPASSSLLHLYFRSRQS
jgi:hypothetical protein